MKNFYSFSPQKFSTHSLIREMIGKAKCILDVGCNDGYIGIHSKESKRFYGLDYSQRSIAKAKVKYKDARVYDLNNLQALPWRKKFDLLIFADVLEHLVDPKKTLSFFVKSYLLTNGRVIISLPNVANWQIRLKLLRGNFDYTNNGILGRTHFHLYTYKTAKELVEQSGLDVIKVQGGATYFGPLIKYFPFLSSLLATNIIFECKKGRK